MENCQLQIMLRFHEDSTPVKSTKSKFHSHFISCGRGHIPLWLRDDSHMISSKKCLILHSFAYFAFFDLLSCFSGIVFDSSSLKRIDLHIQRIFWCKLFVSQVQGWVLSVRLHVLLAPSDTLGWQACREDKNWCQCPHLVLAQTPSRRIRSLFTLLQKANALFSILHFGLEQYAFKNTKIILARKNHRGRDKTEASVKLSEDRHGDSSTARLIHFRLHWHLMEITQELAFSLWRWSHSGQDTHLLHCWQRQSYCPTLFFRDLQD